jgi:hypothetical protein
MKFASARDPGVREGISMEPSKTQNRSMTPFLDDAFVVLQS